MFDDVGARCPSVIISVSGIGCTPTIKIRTGDVNPLCVSRLLVSFCLYLILISEVMLRDLTVMCLLMWILSICSAVLFIDVGMSRSVNVMMCSRY